jgi:diguanylate cyclase (GGDEF)-like protein
VSSAPHPTDPQEARIRRAWRFLAGSFVVLGAIALADVAFGGPGALHVLVLALVGVTATAAVVHRQAVGALEVRRRGEVESFARILQGLSRSVSPDAIVEAIVEDLGQMTGADHIVVVRLRPNTGLLEATLVTTRQGVAASTTILPISDLDDPVHEADDPGDLRSPEPVAVGPGEPLARAGATDGPGGGGGADESIVAEEERVVRLAASGRRSGDRGDEDERGRVAVGGAGIGAAGAGQRAAAQEVAERLARRVRVVYGLRSTLVAPLETSSGVVGAIVLSRRTTEPWPASTGRLLTGAAIEASAALSRAYSHRAAETRASTDALTGLPNRRYFDEFCGLFARRRRAGDAVGILMIDIDKFKVLNDRYGHATGDQVLRAVAGAIVTAVREDDVPARYGGEEFVVLLRNPAPGIAVDVGERVRSAVRTLDLARFGIAEVSVSVGVAVASTPDEPISELIVQADRALYRAKRAGRDRVVAA